jgi:hypothetical protein
VRLADSVMLGGFCLLLAVAGTAGAIAARSRLLSGDNTLDALGGMMCGAPLLAFVNLVFVLRDRWAGRRQEANVGLVLSVLAIVVGWLPLLLAD